MRGLVLASAAIILATTAEARLSIEYGECIAALHESITSLFTGMPNTPSNDLLQKMAPFLKGTNFDQEYTDRYNTLAALHRDAIHRLAERCEAIRLEP